MIFLKHTLALGWEVQTPLEAMALSMEPLEVKTKFS
jgi:hypothetical protein